MSTNVFLDLSFEPVTFYTNDITFLLLNQRLIFEKHIYQTGQNKFNFFSRKSCKNICSQKQFFGNINYKN